MSRLFAYNFLMSVEPDPLKLGQDAAAELSGDWQLDAEPTLEVGAEEPTPSPESALEPPRAPRLFPNRVSDSVEAPPDPDRIIEAMLFAGGPPLTAAKACSAIRGLTPEAFRECVDRIARRYRMQCRPYTVQARHDGFALALKPEFRHLRERLFGGPKEARLTQPALDVLSLVAYRQPVTKPDVDALRGADSGSMLRQLVRLGLLAVSRMPARDGGNRTEVCYGTTARFLELFALTSLDDLPRLADPTHG